VVHHNHPKHAEPTLKVFEAGLRNHVIPLVESQYSVRRDSQGRARSCRWADLTTQFAGFNSLDLFANFGVLSAGDVDSETSIAKFLNDPEVNKKVDYLFVGQGTREAEGPWVGVFPRRAGKDSPRRVRGSSLGAGPRSWHGRGSGPFSLT